IKTAGKDFDFISKPLTTAIDELEATTKWVQQSYKSTPDDAAFGCVDLQRAFSLTYLGWNWLRMAQAAANHSDAGLRQSKRVTAAFFAQRMLSQVPALLANVRNPAEEMMTLDAVNF
ncbi:MAG: acyl-CoA dehydrogenase C-terminal domain-containing protein, partial [Stenotrophobium sp.]